MEAKRYSRAAGISETEIDDGVFLVGRHSQDIFYLDGVCCGLWRLLRQPQTLAEIQTVVRAAFPEQPADRVERDVAAALEEMLASGLLAVAA